MPRYVALIDQTAHSEMLNIAGERARVNRPSEIQPADRPVPDGFMPIHYFDAPDGESAHRYKLHLQAHGCPGDPSVVGDAGKVSGDPKKLWRWRGDVHYIKARLKDFGLPDHTEKQVQANRQFREITNLLGQQCKAYHEARKQDGVAQVPPWQLRGIEGSFAEAEREVSVLGCLLAAAIDAMDAGYRAFGLERRRGFAIAFDAPEPEPAAAHADHHAREPKRPQKATAGAK